MYSIRLAEVDDLPQLPDVERRAVTLFEHWLAETGLTPAVLADVSSLEELEAARVAGHLWVATVDTGEIVGFAQAAILDGLVHLDEVDVVPEHGRQGVGSRLVDAVCRWAEGAGYPAVTLSTFRDVPWNRAFYERRGFRVDEAVAVWPEHRALVDAERARGLRVDVRVIMVRRWPE
jgi:4-diphosphocytidyl-2-C-methyl-D-erythritol kinase